MTEFNIFKVMHPTVHGRVNSVVDVELDASELSGEKAIKLETDSACTDKTVLDRAMLSRHSPMTSAPVVPVRVTPMLTPESPQAKKSKTKNKRKLLEGMVAVDCVGTFDSPGTVSGNLKKEGNGKDNAIIVLSSDDDDEYNKAADEHALASVSKGKPGKRRKEGGSDKTPVKRADVEEVEVISDDEFRNVYVVDLSSDSEGDNESKKKRPGKKQSNGPLNNGDSQRKSLMSTPGSSDNNKGNKSESSAPGPFSPYTPTFPSKSELGCTMAKRFVEQSIREDSDKSHSIIKAACSKLQISGPAKNRQYQQSNHQCPQPNNSQKPQPFKLSQNSNPDHQIAASFMTSPQMKRSFPKLDMLSLSTEHICKKQLRFEEQIKEEDLVGSSSDYAPLRVCSYNILSDTTIPSTMYLYRHLGSDRSALNWMNRWRMLTIELTRLRADVFAFQEVPAQLVDPCFATTLGKGYELRYKKKTGDFTDGCLLAVRKNRFVISQYEEVEYFLGDGETLDKHQIGQVALIKHSKSGEGFIVANTHLLFNEKRGDIKLGQLAILFATINKVRGDSDLPVFVMGDFNIEAYSLLYKFITESQLSILGVHRHGMSGQTDQIPTKAQPINYDILPKDYPVTTKCTFGQKVANENQFTWSHPFNFASVYAHKNSMGRREVSTYHMGVGNPDFIFYSVAKKTKKTESFDIEELPNLKLVSRLSLPDVDSLKSTLGPWPNVGVPSDHIPLVADFAIKIKKE